MTYNRLIHEFLPFEIHYHTKSASGKWESTRLHSRHYSRDEREQELERLQKDVEARRLTHIEYWPATNEAELDRQQAAKVRSEHDFNSII